MAVAPTRPVKPPAEPLTRDPTGRLLLPGA